MSLLKIMTVIETIYYFQSILQLLCTKEVMPSKMLKKAITTFQEMEADSTFASTLNSYIYS